MDLALTHVINISVSRAQTGLGKYNTSNVALFSTDTPDISFGDLGYKIYLSPKEVGTDFGTGSDTYQMALALFSQQPNILAGNGYLVVIPFEPSEILEDAIARTEGLVQYFGVMSTQIETSGDTLGAAAVLLPLNKIGFFVSRDPLEVQPGGRLDLLRSGGFENSRGLFYGADNDTDALLMMASYVGRGLSVNFSGSNTTLTMHLKDLLGIQPDPSMDETLFDFCQAAGADVYASFQGVAKTFCSGDNKFFDQVYNLQWFVGALQVAGFNFLAQSSTKIPQTEGGMDGLKGAYRNVCEQAVTNQYSAPGRWNSPDTFGNQNDFILNIAQRGYYIYSQPISQQPQADREAREAPLVQIALKEAGAIHSSDVIVYINA